MNGMAMHSLRLWWEVVVHDSDVDGLQYTTTLLHSALLVQVTARTATLGYAFLPQFHFRQAVALVIVSVILLQITGQQICKVSLHHLACDCCCAQNMCAYV